MSSSSQEVQARPTLRPSPLIQSLLLVVPGPALGPWEGEVDWVYINSLDWGLSIFSVDRKDMEGSLKHSGGWDPCASPTSC